MRVGLSLCLVVALMLLLQITGCGSAPTPTPTLLPPPDPQTMLSSAVATILDLKSAAFTLEHQVGSTKILPGLAMNKAFGVLEVPDKLSLTVEAESESPRSYVEIKVITIGNRAYITDFFTGQWREEPAEALPVNFVDFGRTLGDIMDAVQAPRLLGPEKLAGRVYDRLEGVVQSEDLASLVPGAAEGFDVVLELWLHQEDGWLRQVVITGQVVASDIPDTVRLLTLDDVNIPVDITAPE